MKIPVTLTQAFAVAFFLCTAAYSVGRVHASLETHEGLEGHPALSERVHQNEVTMAKVAAVLELLRKSQP